jgi:hypothetical protein
LLLRLRVFADLLEWIVFTDEISIESDWKHDLEPWLSEYGLGEAVHYRDPFTAPASEQAPTALSFLGDLTSDADLTGDVVPPDLSDLLADTRAAQALGSIFSPERFVDTTSRHVLEVCDFLMVLHTQSGEPLFPPEMLPWVRLFNAGYQHDDIRREIQSVLQMKFEGDVETLDAAMKAHMPVVCKMLEMTPGELDRMDGDLVSKVFRVMMKRRKCFPVWVS